MLGRHVSSTMSVLVLDTCPLRRSRSMTAVRWATSRTRTQTRASGYAGDRKDSLDFGHAVSDTCDIGDARVSGEGQLGEGLDRESAVGVIDDRGVATDHAGFFEAAYPPCDCRGTEVGGRPDLCERRARVASERGEDPLVSRVGQRGRRHGASIAHGAQSTTRKFGVDGAFTRVSCRLASVVEA
jgi:hypothetical protein